MLAVSRLGRNRHVKTSLRVLCATLGFALVLGLALVGTPTAVAASTTTNAKKSFIASVVSAAQQSQRQFGVPASVSIAQAIEASDWGTSKPATSARNFFETRCSAGMTASQFAKLAEGQAGKPYVLGAEALISNSNPRKFDCSELVQWLFGRSGNPITDLAASQYNVTSSVSTRSPKAGDLVFLRNNPARSNGIGHVAVVTKKLSSGDWEVIEARGRAYGVVKTTLSYWKNRSYYAGMRRYSKLVFADSDGVTASAGSAYQSGCVTIGSTKYSKYSSTSNAFAAHAAAISDDSAYKSARAVMNSTTKYVDALAKVEAPKDAAAYAKTINSLIAGYNLASYNVVPFSLVLDSGNKGAKVSALQYLLLQAGRTLKVTGTYDSTTVSSVKKYQSSKKLVVDGEAGPKTITALIANIQSGSTGSRVSALHALLKAVGYPTSSGSTFGKETLASVTHFQSATGLADSGVVSQSTWAKLFMALEPAPNPKITGTAKVGQTLTAVPGKWGPGSVELAYRWYRGTNPVSGATGKTYAVQPADGGASIKVAVTGVKTGYTSITRISTATGTVARATLTATPAPTVTGRAKVGETLTAVPGTWGPAPVDLSYQWSRGATQISGATKSTYTLQGQDAAAAIKVTVTGNKLGYTTVGKTSAATGAVAKGVLTDTPTPKITGTAKVGATLTAIPGSWGAGPVVLAYSWYRGRTLIAGATKSSYLIQPADAGATIKVTVTGAKAGYTTVSKTSAATGAVAKGTLTLTPKPKITGTAKVGKTLTAVPGTWGQGTIKLSYLWYRGSKAISGTTKVTYTLKSADKGKTISVRVKGFKTGYTSVYVKSGVKVN